MAQHTTLRRKNGPGPQMAAETSVIAVFQSSDVAVDFAGGRGGLEGPPSNTAPLYDRRYGEHEGRRAGTSTSASGRRGRPSGQHSPSQRNYVACAFFVLRCRGRVVHGWQKRGQKIEGDGGGVPWFTL